jgi:copper chaperone CopZ
MSYYIHKVPGRLRVTVPLAKQSLAREVCGLLGPVNGINSTDFNTITGSMVINYDSRVIGPEEILYKLQQAGYFDQMKGVANSQDIMLDTTIPKVGEAVAKVLLCTFVEKTLERSALSLIAALL